MTIIDRNNIPASLNDKSFIGEILVAYGVCTTEDVEEALRIQKDENAALTDADKVAGKKARFTGEILIDLGYASQEDLDEGLEVQKILRGQN